MKESTPGGDRAGAHALLREGLGKRAGLLGLAAAVLDHLAGPSGADPDAHRQAARILALLVADGGDGEVRIASRLQEAPDLLASFFQNADLLDTATPEGALLARALMLALARLHEADG